MIRILYAPVIVLALFLAYTIYSQDLKLVDEREYQKTAVIYTKAKCKFCTNAQELLRQNQILYAEIDITWDPALHKKLQEQTNQSTVPYIFIKDKFVGGYAELLALHKSNRLDELLK